MAKVFHGNSWYHEVDLEVKSEKEVSEIFRTNVGSTYPWLKPYVFEHVLESDGKKTRADLCLIARDMSYWCIVEVEKSNHDYHGHVLPQIRRFKDANIDAGVIKRFCKANNIQADDKLVDLLRGKPPHILVVVDANPENHFWKKALKAEGATLIELRVFRNEQTNLYAIYLEGDPPQSGGTLISKCYAKPSETPYSELVLNTHSCIPVGTETIQLSYRGTTATWRVIRQGTSTSLVLFRKSLLGRRFELHLADGIYSLKETI